jgi:ribose transport system substrate-binding protein
MIDAKVDAILLRPVNETTPVPAVIAARKACIPVFTENRFLDPEGAVAGRDYVTGIGADPVVQGQLIADWLIIAKGGKATIIEIEGTPGTSSAIGRKKGFEDRIATQPGMKIVASESGRFQRSIAHEVVEKLLPLHPKANVIFTHSDMMALGTLDALKSAGRTPGKDVMIVSIDGLKDAVRNVIDGTIAATEFNNPKVGVISFQTIENYMSGRSVPPKIVLRGPVIDATNAQAMISDTF